MWASFVVALRFVLITEMHNWRNKKGSRLTKFEIICCLLLYQSGKIDTETANLNKEECCMYEIMVTCNFYSVKTPIELDCLHVDLFLASKLKSHH